MHNAYPTFPSANFVAATAAHVGAGLLTGPDHAFDVDPPGLSAG